MYCPKCGKQFENETGACPYCGTTIGPWPEPIDGGGLLKMLCLILPLVGIIIYFVQRQLRPAKAAACLRFAVYGLALDVLFELISRLGGK